MRDFFQSVSTFTFSMSLLGVSVLDKLTSTEPSEYKDLATKTLDAVSSTAVDQLGPRLRSTFRALDDVQRGVVGIMFDLFSDLARNSLNRLTDETGPDRRRERDWIHDREHGNVWNPATASDGVEDTAGKKMGAAKVHRRQ
jgi:hypothetical protein